MTSTVVRSDLVAAVDSGDRVVVLRLHAPAEAPLVLEGSAALVWRVLVDPLTTSQLVDDIAQTTGVEPAIVGGDVCTFIDELVALGVLLREG